MVNVTEEFIPKLRAVLRSAKRISADDEQVLLSAGVRFDSSRLLLRRGRDGRWRLASVSRAGSAEKVVGVGCDEGGWLVPGDLAKELGL